MVVVQSRFRSKEPDSMEDRVVRAIMKAWSSLREGLVLMQLKIWRNNYDNRCFGTLGLEAKTYDAWSKKLLSLGRMLGYKLRSVRD